MEGLPDIDWIERNWSLSGIIFDSILIKILFGCISRVAFVNTSSTSTIYHQILPGEGHCAMNVRISILPDYNCYLLSECLVNLTRVQHSLFLYQPFWHKMLIALPGFVLLGFPLYVSSMHCPTTKYYTRRMGKLSHSKFVFIAVCRYITL